MRIKKSKRSFKGETLIETLVAILILTISAMVLAEMTATSVRINRSVENIDAEYRTNLAAVENRTSPEDGTISIKSGEKTFSYEVEYYGKVDGLTSYKLKNGGVE